MTYNNELLNFFVLLSSDADDANDFTDNLLDGIRAESILAGIYGTDAFAARIITEASDGGTEVILDNPIMFDLTNVAVWAELF